MTYTTLAMAALCGMELFLDYMFTFLNDIHNYFTVPAFKDVLFLDYMFTFLNDIHNVYHMHISFLYLALGLCFTFF